MLAIVLTLVQIKHIRININKQNNTKHSKYKYMYYQNTHTIVKTPLHTLNRTLKNKLKQPEYQIHTKRNSHSTIIYPQYKVTLMYMVIFSREIHRNSTSLHFTSLQNKITAHKSRQFTPHQYTSHHFTYLHSIPT